MSASFDIVGVGLNATDTMLLVPQFPGYGGKAPFLDERYSPGGQVASAMVACSTLGLKTKYIGTVGDDLRGKIQLESLTSTGIDISHVQTRENCPNQSAYIIIDQRTGERTVFWHRDDCLRIDPTQIAPEQITCARMLHIDGHDTPAVEHAARIARENDIPVSVDVDTIYHGFDKVLPYVDYLVASTEFPVRWTNEMDPRKALAMIQKEYGMRVAGMTLGHYGSAALCEGKFYYSPAFVMDCIDTTGAGDVFHGAFCYGVLQGYSLDETLEFANAMAAINCQALGARGRIGKLDEARELIRSGRRRANPDYT